MKNEVGASALHLYTLKLQCGAFIVLFICIYKIYAFRIQLTVYEIHIFECTYIAVHTKMLVRLFVKYVEH